MTAKNKWANDVNDISSGHFWQAAGWRAVRTFAQVILITGGINATELLSAKWTGIVATAAGCALVSVLTSVVIGIPEAPAENVAQNYDDPGAENDNAT